jgi:hypothetical protein
MSVGIGTEAALFPEKEYIMEISFAVQYSVDRGGGGGGEGGKLQRRCTDR